MLSNRIKLVLVSIPAQSFDLVNFLHIFYCIVLLSLSYIVNQSVSCVHFVLVAGVPGEELRNHVMVVSEQSFDTRLRLEKSYSYMQTFQNSFHQELRLEERVG